MKKHVADLAELIAETEKDTQNAAFFCSLGNVKKETVEAIRAITDLDLEGYEHIADSYFLKHVRAHHGNEKLEKQRGLIAILSANFLQIPLILEAYDQITYRLAKGNHRFLFEKTVEKTHFTYVAEARIGKSKVFASVTLFAQPVKKGIKKAD